MCLKIMWKKHYWDIIVGKSYSLSDWVNIFTHWDENIMWCEPPGICNGLLWLFRALCFLALVPHWYYLWAQYGGRSHHKDCSARLISVARERLQIIQWPHISQIYMLVHCLSPELYFIKYNLIFSSAKSRLIVIAGLWWKISTHVVGLLSSCWKLWLAQYLYISVFM